MRILVVALLAASLVLIGAARVTWLQPSAARADAVHVLEFDTMAGVTGPFVGSTNPIRGVPGGGLPWQIDLGRGELRADGSLEVEVRGLVLFDGPPVPLALRGVNPIANFRAIVSCLTISAGAPATVNVATDLFPATPTGDADIEATVSLPSPCFAPIVFVTSPGGAWFAVTGN